MLIAVAATLALAACDVDPDSEESIGAEPTVIEPTDTPSVFVTMKPSAPPSLGGAFTGTLGLADIEGGCPYLEAADGTRYQVMYPEGWELRSSPLQLVSPGGDVVARAGDEVAVRGLVMDSMASTCQIGPTIHATEVLTP